MAIPISDLEKIKKDGLKALKDTLGVEGTIKFLQMYSCGNGDYTKERKEIIKDLKLEDFEKFLEEN